MPTILSKCIMRADRARAGGVAAAAASCSFLSLLLLLPAASSIAALIGLLLLAAVHRTLFIRLTPPLPSAAAPSLIVLARTRWLIRGVGTAAVGLAALYTSLGFHSLLLRSCPSVSPASVADGSVQSEAAACLPNSSLFAAAFAALTAVSVGIDHATGGADELLLPGGASLWPLVAQSPFLRLRPGLPEAVARSARLSVQCGISLLVLAWLWPAMLTRIGGTALSAGGCCAPCFASASNAGSASALVPSVSELFSLLLRGTAFRFCVAVVLASVRIAYTLPVDFRAATYQLGDDTAAAAEAALAAALSKASPALTQHLGYYDLANLAMHDPPRRRSLFALERGSAWPHLLRLLLQPLETTAAALEAARKRRVAPPPPPLQVPLVPRPLVGRLQRLHAMIVEQCTASMIFGASQLVVWAAEALSGLIAASANEDSLGTVQQANSLALALAALLRALHALETYVAGAPRGLGGIPGAGAGRSSVAPPPVGTAPRSQQSLALRLALGPAAQSRAAGFEQASAALEGALSRAIYLLVHTFGRRVVLAADVPAELRPRLESFLSELY